jgi:hypothetical protein
MMITSTIPPLNRENNIRVATVQTVDLERFTATVVDSFGAYYAVTLRVQPNRLPCVGETWLLDRTPGYFTFMAPLDSLITAARKYTTTIGDDPTEETVEFNINHNMGTTDVAVEVYEIDTGETVFAPFTVERISTNTVRLVFDIAPDEDAYRVVVVG